MSLAGRANQVKVWSEIRRVEIWTTFTRIAKHRTLRQYLAAMLRMTSRGGRDDHVRLNSEYFAALLRMTNRGGRDDHGLLNSTIVPRSPAEAEMQTTPSCARFCIEELKSVVLEDNTDHPSEQERNHASLLSAAWAFSLVIIKHTHPGSLKAAFHREGRRDGLVGGTLHAVNGLAIALSKSVVNIYKYILRIYMHAILSLCLSEILDLRIKYASFSHTTI
jgi:hypothetical protein